MKDESEIREQFEELVAEEGQKRAAGGDLSPYYQGMKAAFGWVLEEYDKL